MEGLDAVVTGAGGWYRPPRDVLAPRQTREARRRLLVGSQDQRREEPPVVSGADRDAEGRAVREQRELPTSRRGPNPGDGDEGSADRVPNGISGAAHEAGESRGPGVGRGPDSSYLRSLANDAFQLARRLATLADRASGANEEPHIVTPRESREG